MISGISETSLPGGPAGRLHAPVEINQVLFRQVHLERSDRDVARRHALLLTLDSSAADDRVRGPRCLQLTNSVVPMK